VSRRGLVPGRWRGVAAAGVAALLLSACATVPDSGPVQAGKVAATTSGPGQGYLQQIPMLPKASWTPKQVVLGFLTACASFANGHAVARAYLDPGVRAKWNPTWAVTVVRGALKVKQHTINPRQAGIPSQMAKVKATGEKLATLTDNGQYIVTTGSSTYKFLLAKIAGRWVIENPPSRLLLTEPAFKQVYSPRNLYYVASRAHVLVPDPVFVPLQATSAKTAFELVTALLQQPRGLLAGGVSTAFPSGTKLLRVALSDGTAVIDLGGSAAHASQAQLNGMRSQLVWTLAGASSGQSAIQSVQLQINGVLRRSASLTGGQVYQNPAGLSVPEAGPDTPLYSVNDRGAVQKLTQPDSEVHSVPGEAGEGRVHLNTIAVSYNEKYVAGVSPSRKVVYYGPIRRGARLTRWRVQGAGVTSLSWDARDELWVTSPGRVWILRAGGQPILPGTGGAVVSQLRIAPDGVRVAMIVQDPHGSHLELAAINRPSGGSPYLPNQVPIGTSVLNPTQLTWYDANNLIVLTGPPTHPQLYEVPVNGGSSTPLATYGGTQSITAAGPAVPMAAGLADGRLALESNLNGTWTPRAGAAGSPAYPAG
jgi:Lipoprotein LpqB beta-propeller domain/Sporulation and spore germination